MPPLSRVTSNVEVTPAVESAIAETCTTVAGRKVAELGERITEPQRSRNSTR